MDIAASTIGEERQSNDAPAANGTQVAARRGATWNV
jgi:hypothetical protein